MKSLDNIAEDLFNKIRGRFPSVTIGDADGKVINDPLAARFFDFDFKEGDKNLGKVSISVSEDALAVMYSNNFVENEDAVTKKGWYNFLRELRTFAKKRLLSFDTRDITKSNLNKRDYKFLAQQQGGDAVMSESKLYGTSRVSYQDIGSARLNIRHTESVDQEIAGGRAKKIGTIYIESAEGERFKYPYKHLSGARAMARHVAEGGKPFDDFGKHITSLSEEMYKLRKFKTYMGRSAVMAESLSEYMDVVKDRITTVKKTIESLQKPNTYKEAFESFEAPVLEDVPEDVAENWIDQLTIRQFNEELKDVFPYIYKLVSEATKAEEITPEDVTTEDDDPCWKDYEMIGMKKKNGKEVPNCVPKKESTDPIETAVESLMGQFAESDFEEEEETPQIPMTEFILSHYDYTTGQFPKGETAVLTGVEKDYGEQYINHAKKFIEMINAKFEEVHGYKDPDFVDEGGMGTHAIANTEIGDKIVKALDDRPTKGLSKLNLMKLAQEKLGPLWYDLIGLSDEEKAQAQADMERITGIEEGMTKKVCKSCGDEFDKPTTNCQYDSHDPTGDNWIEIDIDGDGRGDIAVTAEKTDIMKLAGLA